MSFKTTLLICLIFLSIFWPILLGFGITSAVLSLGSTDEDPEPMNYSYFWGDENSSNKLLSIPIYGPILDDQPSLGSFDSLFNTFATYGVTIKDELYEVAKDDSIAGVILEINSPGGTVTGSKAIADGIAYYRETTGKPVYAYASGLMASGGYWVGASGDQIYVETGSLVGSIGVIGGQFATYNNVVAMSEGLVGSSVTTTDGIDVTTITAGEGKDFGNPFRAPTEKELSIMQESTNQAYETFVNYVAGRRKIPHDTIVNEIGAYVYGEQQAQDRNLIDIIGTREMAYQGLAQQLSLDSFQIVRNSPKSGILSSLLEAATSVKQPMQAKNKLNSTSCIYAQRAMAFHGNVFDLCL